MAAGQTVRKGGTMRQAIYRAVVLALLLPGTYSQMSGWSLTSINGKTTPSAWAVNRTDTLTLVLSYSCFTMPDTVYIYLQDANRYYSQTLGVQTCTQGSTGTKTVTADLAANLYSIYGSSDGSYVIFLQPTSSSSKTSYFTVTRPYTDFVRIAVPTSNGQNFKELDTLPVSVRYGINDRWTYSYYNPYTKAIITGPDGSTTVDLGDSQYPDSFYGYTNFTGLIFYGIAGITADGTYTVTAQGYVLSTMTYTPTLTYTDTVTVDLTFDSIRSLTVPSQTCTYDKDDCGFKWVAGTSTTRVNVYFVATAASAEPTYDPNSGSFMINNVAMTPYMTNVTAGTYSFPAVKGTSPGLLSETRYTIWLVVLDRSGYYQSLRTRSVTFEVACTFPTYGTTCAESQNLVNSFAVGFFSAAMVLIVLLFAFMGDWVGRWADRARKSLTERAVTICRNMVSAFNALAATDAAKLAEEEALKKEQEEAAKLEAKRRNAGLVAGAAVGGGVALAGAGLMAANQAGALDRDGGGDSNRPDDSGLGALRDATKDAVMESSRVVTDRMKEVATTQAKALANARFMTAPAAPTTSMDPITWIKKKALPVMKEVAMVTVIYAGAVIGQYLMDFLQILANGLLMIKSFASSFDMKLDIVFPSITVNINMVLPKWLHWFPRAFSSALAWFQRIFANISFGELAMKNMQVTCVGAQAPGEVLNNLILIIILFLCYEVYFLEAIRVTFRGFARVSTQFVKRKSMVMGRVASFTLPGCAVAMESGVKYILQFVFALLVISSFFEYKGGHARTDKCDSYAAGMDSVIARLGTALFWCTVLPIIHLALKALIPGLPAGELSTPLLAVRNRTLKEVLNAASDEDKLEPEAMVDEEAGMAQKADKKSDKKGKKGGKGKGKAAEVKSKRRGGCVASCLWALFDLIFGFDRKAGLETEARSITALQSPRSPRDSGSGKRASCPSCFGAKRGAMADAPPETPASPTSTRPLNGGRKCCACLRNWTFRGFFTKAWRFLRLSVVLGCICFCLMRFLFVILAASEVSQAMSLELKCPTLQSYSSIMSNTDAPTAAPTPMSSGMWSGMSPTPVPSTSSKDSYNYYSSYTSAWGCNYYTEYFRNDYSEPCKAWVGCLNEHAAVSYTTKQAMRQSAILAIPLAVMWLIFCAFTAWHQRQCKEQIVFRDVQRVLPSCVLRTFGYVSRSEKKLQKRLNKLAELDKKAAAVASPRNSMSRRFSAAKLWSPKDGEGARPASTSFSLGAAPGQRRSLTTALNIDVPANPETLLTLPDKVGMLDSTVGGAGMDSPRSPTAKSPKQVTPRSSKGLRKLRGQLPRAWPSMYAVYEMIKDPAKEGVVWEDLVEAKRSLDVMKRTGKGPIPITDEYLKRSFVYQLIKRCEEDVEYEATIKQIFQIVATFTDDELARSPAQTPTQLSPQNSTQLSPQTSMKLAPQANIALAGDDTEKGEKGKVAEMKAQVKAVAGDLLSVASAAMRSPRSVTGEEGSMDYSEFRHFVSILVPPREVPSYLELILAMMIDVKAAFQKWRTEDKGALRRLWVVPLYWASGTLRLYVVVMYWKLKQLMKLTFGFWDRELIEAFRIRDRADEFDEDPDDDRECDLDILAATGQTRVLFWQIMPYTVVLSKLGEAFNFSPPYIEDAAMTERVSFKRSIDDTGKMIYEGEPVLRSIKPFAPAGLAWLFPLEYRRALETGAGGLSGGGIRLQSFVVSCSKFFTTLMLVAFPRALWLQLYFLLTVPLRLLDSVDLVASLNIVDTDLLKETFGPIWEDIKGLFSQNQDATGQQEEGEEEEGGDVNEIEVDAADGGDGAEDQPQQAGEPQDRRKSMRAAMLALGGEEEGQRSAADMEIDQATAEEGEGQGHSERSNRGSLFGGNMEGMGGGSINDIEGAKAPELQEEGEEKTKEVQSK